MRVTTSSVLKNYKLTLNNSYGRMSSAQKTVLTQRNFNSYAEDPSAATQAFKLRRAYLRTNDQVSNNSGIVNKFATAYKVLDNVSDLASDANSAVLRALNDPTGAGRNALGQSLLSSADSIVQMMNTKYGDSFVFAGSDGLNVPFSWGDDGKLMYRGICVDDAANADQLRNLVENDGAYIDIGMGLKEDADGKLVESSAFNSALCGLGFIGYGADDNGDSDNIASVVKRLGTLLSSCDPATGEWDKPEDAEEAARLQVKLSDLMSDLTSATTDLSTRSNFLETNLSQLTDSAYLLNEQICGIEDCDLADAISSFSWAQYCYNAALKVGNSVLSQSLMDYLGG